MRITELLEGKFNELDFVTKEGDKEEIDFDLTEDLAFFLNHDDDVYRRHTYPAITKCVDRSALKVNTNPQIFKLAVEEGYKEYVKKYPIRHLPDALDEEMCNEVCEKMYDDVCKDIKDGKYKD